MNITTEQIFTEARSQNGFLDAPVPDTTLRALYDLMKWGPTSVNCQPARVVFVRSEAEKARLVACVSPANQPKVQSAPVTAIIGMDMAFHEQLPRLVPHVDARSWFLGNAPMIEATAFRNSSMQAAYLIIAARELGLDCGPMSGFDADRVDAQFWPGTQVRTNVLCTLGKGDPSKVHPRLPRLDFDEVCRLA